MGEVQALKRKNQPFENAFQLTGDFAMKREKSSGADAEKKAENQARFTGWTRQKKAGPDPPRQKKAEPPTTFRSMEFSKSTSFSVDDQEEPSQAFSVASTMEKRSSGL